LEPQHPLLASTRGGLDQSAASRKWRHCGYVGDGRLIGDRGVNFPGSHRFRCNAGKRDTDSTDFRGLQASYALREAGCVFCALEGSGRVLLENELALCIADAYPVTPAHSLVIPRRHVADGLALHQPEWNAVVELLKLRREQLSAQDATISGWNVGLNSGEAAGQTVFHAHWHLIPRRDGDCEEPRGGVRGVITGRQGY
jgi:diadenosine tetraphosphate (Ap4A) HIT family hydrolase